MAAIPAAVTQAIASVEQSKAAVDRANRNLGYCTINSPVKGVIIDRRVNIGQTVVSSLSAPSLFLIAKDLNKMQVWASVNEADVGNLRLDRLGALLLACQLGHRKGLFMSTGEILAAIDDPIGAGDLVDQPQVNADLCLPNGL